MIIAIIIYAFLMGYIIGRAPIDEQPLADCPLCSRPAYLHETIGECPV